MAGYFRLNESLKVLWTSQIFVLYSFVALMFAVYTSARVEVSLELLRYDNPTHKELSGKCCEWVCWGFLQLGVCDNRFSLCIDDPGDWDTSMDSCAYRKMDDFYSGNDGFNFPDSFEFHRNPIEFEIPDYKGGIRLKMDVWDKEVFHNVNPEDHVDFYAEDIMINPSTTKTYRTLHGSGYSTIDIAISVVCATDYYGNFCSTFCSPRDNYWEGHYTCDYSSGDKICKAGYEGPDCENEIDECESSPCENNGGCRDHLNYFTCECVTGTTGDRCEINLDECASHPCQHGSSCVDEINAYHCRCVGGYTGPTCGTEIDECNSDPCENGATCHDRVNGYTCECLAGYEGPMCHSKISMCANNPCKNNAACVDLIQRFSCECVDGFEGEFCEINTDECQSNPCQNDGSCVDLIRGFQCKCVDGYYGEVCENDVDECASDPCENGATCIDNVNGYVCTCAEGFKGVSCETEINECQSNPCQNSGTCVDRMNGFYCNCTWGYYGLICETDRDECASYPCVNNGTCINDSNGFFCSCGSGFEGKLCETNTNECQSNPCQNSGSCGDMIDGFLCDCLPGYHGPLCEDKDVKDEIPPESKRTSWIWLLIIVPMIVAIGIFVFKTHGYRHAGTAWRRSIKYKKLHNSEAVP